MKLKKFFYFQKKKTLKKNIRKLQYILKKKENIQKVKKYIFSLTLFLFYKLFFI